MQLTALFFSSIIVPVDERAQGDIISNDVSLETSVLVLRIPNRHLVDQLCVHQCIYRANVDLGLYISLYEEEMVPVEKLRRFSKIIMPRRGLFERSRAGMANEIYNIRVAIAGLGAVAEKLKRPMFLIL